ncbi:MAG: MFS transporter, partial [Solirubrobacteraceae bacterium]
MIVCLAQLMIVLDVTIVNVALPSIQRDLRFSQANLSWVVNAFLVTFGSLLLLAGRLGDLAGRKRVFLAGVTVFTIASLLCAIAPSQGALIGARLLQGVGAAAQASVILAIIVIEFPKPAERARAMSAYVFVSVAGGSLGLLAGGLLTQALSWHWVFFVNLPIGAATFLLASALIRGDSGLGLAHGVDWLGSLLVTVSLMSTIYAIVQATNHGWGSAPVLGFGGLAAALMAAFVTLEARIANPIMPLRILRLRGLVNASLVRGLLVTGMYSTFFLGTLYLEHVRHYGPVQTGAAFLPWTLTVAALSRGQRRNRDRRRRTAAVQLSRAAHRILPNDLRRQLRDRPRHRQRVHAPADTRDARRPSSRRRARLGHHQRLPANQRRARTGRPQHRRDQPHQSPHLLPPPPHHLPDQRLPRRVPHRRRSHDHRARARDRAPTPDTTRATTRSRPARPRQPRTPPASSMTPTHRPHATYLHD